MGYILYTRAPAGIDIFDLLTDWNADSVAAFLKLQGYEGSPLQKDQPFDGGSYGVGLCTDEHIGAQDLPITGSELIEKPDGSFVYRMTHQARRDPLHDEIDAHRAKLIAAGVAVDVTGAGVIPIKGSPNEQMVLMGLAQAALLRKQVGQNVHTSFRDAKNNTHNLTNDQLIELWSKGAAFVKTVMQASWTLKDSDPIPQDWADAKHWPTN
ncbi:MAG: DUF4376 domain-containing protein [Cohaesibacter sp.]|nr:DUF4376 domain-containing protein [Cohaesibacter sp.]